MHFLSKTFLLIAALLAVVLADPCFKKPDPGPCKALFTKYFYDQKTKTCKSFIWGGCLGVVPFQTLAECQEAKCTCKERPAVGPCRARIPRYFFNQRTKKCQVFYWGGCRGNVPFQTIESCKKQCEAPNPCLELPETGPCRGYFPKYYFDKKTMKCTQFIWGGCAGNVPFQTLEECEKASCGKYHK